MKISGEGVYVVLGRIIRGEKHSWVPEQLCRTLEEAWKYIQAQTDLSGLIPSGITRGDFDVKKRVGEKLRNLTKREKEILRNIRASS